MYYEYQEKIPSDKNFRLFRNKDAIRFHWDIITHCNFKCPYCYARAKEGNWFKISSLELIKKTLKKLEKIQKPLEIILLGGEPTLHPKYFEIIEEVSKLPQDLEFGIISNGMFKDPLKFIQKHKKYNKNFSFSITFHPSQHNDKSIQEFKNNLKIINDEGFLLNVNIILDKIENDKIIREILDFLKLNNIGFYYNVPFFSNDFYVEHFDISDNYKKWLLDINLEYMGQKELKYYRKDKENIYNDIDVVLNNLQDFKGWTCKNNNFEIKAGTSDFIRMCSSGSEKYTVQDINNLKDMICPLNKCLCQGLLSNEKIRTTK